MPKQRNHIVILDDDGDLHFHAIAIAPEGVEVAEAKKTITGIFRDVKRANPDEWHYGEVLEKLVALDGWDIVSPNDTNHDLWIEEVDG